MGRVDWKSVVGTVAPTIATALGGPLAGMAVGAVSQALLGRPDASEADIEQAIARTNDPEQLLKLKQAEVSFAAQMKQLDVDLVAIAVEDRASARARQIALKDATPTILAAMYTVGYFLVLIFLWISPPASQEGLVNTLLGILSAAQMAIIAYYYGSTTGSAQKSDTIDRLVSRG